MLTIDRHHIIAIIFFIHFVVRDSCSETCNSAIVHKRNNYSHDLYPWSYYVWYNTTFWGGYEIIASKDNIGPHCWNLYSDYNFLVLSEKNPDISELSAEYQTLQACIMNQSGHCIGNATVQVMNCDGHILYRFWNDSTLHHYLDDLYICFDRIYEDTCENVALPLPATHVNNSVCLVQIKWNELELGWYDSFYGGKNFTIPLIKDLNSISGMCYDKYNAGIYVQETQPLDIGETPVGMRVCLLSDYDYDTYYHEYDFNNYLYYCDFHVFMRVCNGRLQIDLSLSIYQEDHICLVRADDVKVIPEIRHTIQHVDQGEKIVKFYTPYLQYRCSFQMSEADMYKVKWYINGIFLTEKGPANNADELVLKEYDLNDSTLGYTVKCSLVVVSRKRSTTEDFESPSEEFFAGFKVQDSTIELSKTSTITTSVEMTVPIGCSYNDASSPNCQETLTMIDQIYEDDKCSDGVNSVNSYNTYLKGHSVKSLMLNEEWTGSTNYPFKLETVDRTNDDRTTIDMNPQLTSVIVTDKQAADVVVDVTQWEDSKNRMCYSHVDPHMRTGDLSTYEQQEEGDYMLYRNRKYMIEVQERAKPCSHYDRPVCACAVIVSAGKDAFKINRCDGQNEIEFIQCSNCGILDVVKISDSQYDIYTPIGTKVSVKLLKTWGNGRNMNIDIYLMEKDYKQTAGLCGFFDGNPDNDFRLRNGRTVDGNAGNTFSNSWRLSPTENLFKNPERDLDNWNDVIPKCHRDGSITVQKCSQTNSSCFPGRKKRATDDKTLKRKTSRDKSTDIYRKKRSIVTNLTDSEAEQICRDAVYNAPAVLEFPDKLAGEDLENVVDQCFYDVVQEHDPSWADAHVLALNNIAMNILNLNPVFKTNNSDSVETFLSHTCVHNCSNNGICSKEGLCNCTGVYRGHDCSTDIRIPPIISDILNGGKCSGDDEDECTCFIIKTENIFEGFQCDIKTFKMSFNGERTEIGSSKHVGEYDDEFTGVCCAPAERRKRSETDTEYEPFIYAYDIAISNDGLNFGEISPVHMYDASCLYLEENNGVIFVELKNGYCFIDDACINTASTLETGNDSECLVCDPNKNKYTWTTADCSEKDSGEKDSGLSTPALIGIIIALILVTLIAAVLLLYCACCKSSKRAVGVVSAETAHAVDNNAKMVFDMTTLNAGMMSNDSKTRSVNEAYFDGRKLKKGDYMSHYENCEFSSDSRSLGRHGSSSSVKDLDGHKLERGLSAVSIKLF